MKALITVLGKDKVGIIAGVSALLKEKNVNIEDISQTILGGYFTMIMAVSLPKSSNFEDIKTALDNLGGALGVEISLRNKEIFDAINKL